MSYEADSTDVPDESTEPTIVSYMTRFNISREECLEMVDEITDAFGESSPVSIESLKRLEEKHSQAWNILRAYQAQQNSLSDMLMATCCMALELGYYTAAGADNVTEMAKKIGVSKQAANKCADVFRSKLGLPPRPGQRCHVARKNMSLSRNSQLKK
jgi:hypothetical protein